MLDRGESDDKAKNSCSHFLALLTQSYSPEQISSNFHNDVFQVTEHDVLHNISEIDLEKLRHFLRTPLSNVQVNILISSAFYIVSLFF